MIRGMVFDLDDTLYDYQSLEKEARNTVEQYAEKTFKIKRELFADAFRIGKDKVKKQLPYVAAGHNRFLYYQKTLEYLGYFPLSAALELEQEYWNYFLTNMKLNKGVKELFNLIKEMKWKIGICTDLTAQIQFQKIRKLGLEQWIDCVVTSEEAGVEKPHPEIFRLCLEKMKLDCKEVILVGDNLSRDIEGAKRVGIKTVWYAKEGKRQEQKDSISVRNFAELIEEVKHGFI